MSPFIVLILYNNKGHTPHKDDLEWLQKVLSSYTSGTHNSRRSVLQTEEYQDQRAWSRTHLVDLGSSEVSSMSGWSREDLGEH